MSVRRLHYIQCDGCGRPCGTGQDLKDSGVAARAYAKRKGWLRIPKRNATAGGSPGQDLCPVCKVA